MKASSLRCPNCGSKPQLVTGKEVYPHRQDLSSVKIYRCPTHTDIYVGCHAGTTAPLGVLSSPSQRRWKIACHKLFDARWKGKYMPGLRSSLYLRLSKDMGKCLKDTHFGMFTEEELKRAYAIISSWDIEDDAQNFL